MFKPDDKWKYISSARSGHSFGKETRFYGQICYSFVSRVGLSARVSESSRVSGFIFMSLPADLRAPPSNSNAATYRVCC